MKISIDKEIDGGWFQRLLFWRDDFIGQWFLQNGMSTDIQDGMLTHTQLTKQKLEDFHTAHANPALREMIDGADWENDKIFLFLS